jgi:hypothetical protein
MYLNEYFDNKNYNTEIFDYLINVTPEVFKLTMYNFHLKNEYMFSINKTVLESSLINKTIYLIREKFANS